MDVVPMSVVRAQRCWHRVRNGRGWALRWVVVAPCETHAVSLGSAMGVLRLGDAVVASLTKSGLPKTKVKYKNIVLADYDAGDNTWTTFWFPREMIAFPLSVEGRKGDKPSEKVCEVPDWWPYFQ